MRVEVADQEETMKRISPIRSRAPVHDYPTPPSRARRALAAALAAVALLLLAGCSHDVIHIESNTVWEGAVNNSITFSGRGDATYEMHGKLGCVLLQKTLPDTLYLRMRINTKPWEETRAPSGVIYQCK